MVRKNETGASQKAAHTQALFDFAGQLKRNSLMRSSRRVSRIACPLCTWLNMRDIQEMNDSTPPPDGEALFRNIVAGATATAFGLVFCALACVGREKTGTLDFEWHWTALLWLGIGASAGWSFWKLAWWSEQTARPHAKAWFFAFCAVICALTLFLFVRPLRFVARENVQDVLVGMALAVAVLALFGYMIFTLVRWFSQEE